MNRMKRSNLLLAEMRAEELIRAYEAVGLAVAVIEADGTTVYQRFYGYADAQSRQLIDKDTIFGLASVTKSFTALAIMQLYEAGKLDIEDPISKYIPEFSNKNQKTVRIRHLLTHSGGFFPLPRIVVDDVAAELGLDEAKDGDLAYSKALSEEGRKRVAERLDSLTSEHGLSGVPGQYFSYCNDGFGLLSEIVRLVSGEDSFAGYLNRHILAPLGMERSFCDFVRPAADKNAAKLYKKKNGVMVSSRDYHDNAFVLNGGGAMKSTLADLKKYLCMYLNKGSLGKAAAQLAKKQESGAEGTQGKAAAEKSRVLSACGIEEMCKGQMPYLARGSYGYGLSQHQLDDLRVIGHGGSLPGVSSNIAWSYEAGMAVIVLCNTSGVPVAQISDAFMRAYNGRSPIDRRDSWQECSWSEETLTEAAGHYASGEGTRLEIYKTASGEPGLILDGEEKPLIPVTEDAAIIRNRYSDGYMRLLRREGGNIFAAAYGSRLIPKEGVFDLPDVPMEED